MAECNLITDGQFWELASMLAAIWVTLQVIQLVRTLRAYRRDLRRED